MKSDRRNTQPSENIILPAVNNQNVTMQGVPARLTDFATKVESKQESRERIGSDEDIRIVLDNKAEGDDDA